MATPENLKGEIIERGVKDGRPEAAGSGRAQADGAVYEKLVERVRTLEESLKEVQDHDEGAKELGNGDAADPCQMIRGAGMHSCSAKAGAAAVEKVLQGNKPCSSFRMPMHYPRYSKVDYEVMPEWRLDRLFQEYGLPVNVASTLAEKREYAMGVFLWDTDA